VSRSTTRTAREEWKQQKESHFVASQFVATHVIPLVPELSRESHAAGCSAEIVRAKGTGRMTVRYEFGNGEAIYAKAYNDDSLGPHAYRCLRHLWDHGLDPRSKEQVPEPLGYVAEERMLLMRAAQGTAVDSLFATGSIEPAMQGARAAAHWLAQFHSIEIPFLPAELPCERIEIFKVAALLAKVAGACPGKAWLLLEVNHLFRTLAPSSNTPTKLVPLHGQYRPAHVFLDGDRVTVIDLDKIRLSDPAKDVARFIHVLKKSCFEAGGDLERAELLAREFVEEYRVLAPGNLTSLPYYYALYCLKAFAKTVKSGKVQEETRSSLEQLYLDEFEQCVQQGSRLMAA
jgi:aminoglycoside phosphotransferase (APT) family kinase protein